MYEGESYEQANHHAADSRNCGGADLPVQCGNAGICREENHRYHHGDHRFLHHCFLILRIADAAVLNCAFLFHYICFLHLVSDHHNNGDNNRSHYHNLRDDHNNHYNYHNHRIHHRNHNHFNHRLYGSACGLSGADAVCGERQRSDADALRLAQ